MFRILIADDHAIVREGLKLLLVEEFPSAYIGEAQDTDTLLELAATQAWDIIISDIKMPGGGAFVALERLGTRRPAIPFIVISSYTDDFYAEKAMKAGAYRFISKDALSTDLVKAVQELLDKA